MSSSVPSRWPEDVVGPDVLGHPKLLQHFPGVRLQGQAIANLADLWLLLVQCPFDMGVLRQCNSSCETSRATADNGDPDLGALSQPSYHDGL